jgi:hypothetical protein
LLSAARFRPERAALFLDPAVVQCESGAISLQLCEVEPSRQFRNSGAVSKVDACRIE